MRLTAVVGDLKGFAASSTEMAAFLLHSGLNQTSGLSLVGINNK
jgi:hypothetical protein